MDESMTDRMRQLAEGLDRALTLDEGLLDEEDRCLRAIAVALGYSDILGILDLEMARGAVARAYVAGRVRERRERERSEVTFVVREEEKDVSTES